jgi:CelD/BcsL family acetyltransferase involved in cellulose biosynthesis
MSSANTVEQEPRDAAPSGAQTAPARGGAPGNPGEFDIHGGRYRIDVLKRGDVSAEVIRQWAELEQRSVEGNAYLSPHFLLPAVTHLTPGADVFFVFISLVSGNARRMTGAGAFERSRGTRTLPLPHLRAYSSHHSPLSGLLIDEQQMEPTLEAFFRYLGTLRGHSYGIEFKNRTAGTRLAGAMEAAASRHGATWIPYVRKQRSLLVPGRIAGDYLEKLPSSKLRKNIRRFQKQLAERGPVQWRLVNGGQIRNDCIDRFLTLEHSGWKGEDGSSLLSRPGEETFFREMIDGFAREGRAFFTELSVNDQVIASTSNLISSRMGYAFKIGWDMQYAPVSPGILNEVEFIKRAATTHPHLEYIDSGADEGSFIDKLWNDRYELVSGYFVTRTISRAVLTAIANARRMKRWMSGIRAGQGPERPGDQQS